MAHEKEARPDHPIQPVLARRWSPYVFADTEVSSADLCAILEAARWAPSSYNEQPWRYLLARRSDPPRFEKLLSCLAEVNQTWAKNAPVLLVGVAMLTFARNGRPNRAAFHDLGLASGNLCVEATARGLFVHQMIGILPERVRELYRLPEGAEALTALAIGHLGSGDGVDEALRARDRGSRARRPLAAFVFEDAWDTPARLA